MPKFPPPPRTAQKRSGSSSWLARKTLPSAGTNSTPERLSRASPNFPISQPSPSAEREFGNPGARDHPARHGEIVKLETEGHCERSADSRSLDETNTVIGLAS